MKTVLFVPEGCELKILQWEPIVIVETRGCALSDLKIIQGAEELEIRKAEDGV